MKLHVIPLRAPVLLLAVSVLATTPFVHAQPGQQPLADPDFGGSDEEDTLLVDEAQSSDGGGNDVAEETDQGADGRAYYRSQMALNADSCQMDLQAAVRQDRGRAPRQSHPELEASDCVDPLTPDMDGASSYGGFINHCEHPVALSYCVFSSDPESWAAAFDCRQERFGLLTIKGSNEAPDNVVGAPTDANELSWGACRYPESMPADVGFDLDQQLIRFRCHAWLLPEDENATATAAAGETRPSRVPQSCEEQDLTSFPAQYAAELREQAEASLAGTAGSSRNQDGSTDERDYAESSPGASPAAGGRQGNPGIDFSPPANGNRRAPVCQAIPFSYAVALITQPALDSAWGQSNGTFQSLNIWIKGYFLDVLAQLPGCATEYEDQRDDLEAMRQTCNDYNASLPAELAENASDCGGTNLLTPEQMAELEAMTVNFLDPVLWHGPVSASCSAGITQLNAEEEIKRETQPAELVGDYSALANFQYQMYLEAKRRDHYMNACAGSPEYPQHFMFAALFKATERQCLNAGHDAQACVPNKAW